MKKFAMVMVVLAAFAMIVNCAKKEEVVQKAAPEVETPAPAPAAEVAPVVADSAAVAVTDTTAAVPAEQPAEGLKHM